MISSIRKAAIFLSGSGSWAIANFIVFSLLLHSLSKVEYGNFIYVQTIALWLVVAVQFGTSISGSTLLVNKTVDKQRLAGEIVWFKVCVALICAVILVFFALSSEGAVRLLFFSYIPYLFTNALWLDFLLIASQKSWAMSLSQSAMSIAYILTTLACLKLHIPYWILPVLVAASQLIAVIIQYKGEMSFAYLCKLRIFRPVSFRNVIIGLLPASLAQFVQIGYYNIDIVLLGVMHIASRQDLGEYGAVSRLMQTGVLPLVALVYVFGPQISLAWSRQEYEKINSLVRRFAILSCIIGMVGGILIWKFSPIVLERLSDKDLPVAHMMSGIFGATYFFVGLHSAFSVALAFKPADVGYLKVNAVGFFTALLFCSYAIPRFNLIGAGMGILSGVVAISISSFLIYRRTLSDGSRLKKVVNYE